MLWGTNDGICGCGETSPCTKCLAARTDGRSSFGHRAQLQPPLRALPTYSRLTAKLFTRATPVSAQAHAQTGENAVGNQGVPDKLVQVGTERWAVDRAVRCRTNSHSGQGRRMSAPFHVPRPDDDAEIKL